MNIVPELCARIDVGSVTGRGMHADVILQTKDRGSQTYDRLLPITKSLFRITLILRKKLNLTISNTTVWNSNINQNEIGRLLNRTKRVYNI